MADSSRFQSLALHLAQGCALRDAAGKSGVSERTAYRVVKKPAFRKLVKRCRSRLWRSLSGKLVAACDDAITELRRVATDSASPATARVSACRGLIEAALRFKDSADVERRLNELEGRVGTHATVN